jgi:hypothetical protein
MKGSGRQLVRKAALFFLVVSLLMPWSVLAGLNPGEEILSTGQFPVLANGLSPRIYLPLTIRCADCQSLIGNWKISTPDETHMATFLTNGIFSMLFQGETTANYGNYICTGGQFEGLIVVETVSLKFKGALTCNGTGMNGTWEIRNNGVLIDTGNFSGQKL